MQSWLPFINNGSSEVPSFGAVRITGYETDNDGYVIISGDQPDSAANVMVGTNNIVPIAAGKQGLLTLDTLAWAAYDTADGTPANGEMWGPDNGSWKLKKDQGSLWHVVGADSDNETVLVARMGLSAFWGVTDTTHNKDSESAISVYSGAPGTESDTGDNEDAENSFANVATGKQVIAIRLNSTNYLISAECG